MEGEARSRKADYGREKHGPLSLRKRAFQDKKVKSESLTYSSGSIGEKSLDGMIVVGKGCHFTKSRSYDSAHFLHEYHSEVAIHPVSSDTKLRDNVPSEGLEIGLPAYHSVSSTSFTSAKSDLSNNADALQKRIQEMENEISSKNATIYKLKKEMGKSGNFECKSQSVETDLTFEIMEDYEMKLKDLKKSVNDRDKKINDLTLMLEETMKAKSLQSEENKGLLHEINLLNRQLQSMHELIHSQKWDSFSNGGELKEVAKYKTRITELEFTLSKQDILLKELNRTIEKHDLSLKTKEKELKAKSQEKSDHKNKSSLEIRKLMNEIDTLRKGSSKSKKEDFEEYKENVLKISNLPRNLIEKMLSLCETGDFNTVKNIAEQRETYERKLSSIREEHGNEIKRLTDIHDSKLNFLKKEIEMLNEQLRERNGMLETYENELSLYRSGTTVIPKDDDLSSLKEIFNAEIASQKQIHKLEMDLFEEKVKRLSEDILFRAKNEEMHLQELQSAKATANTFKEKYEQLLEQWEEKTKGSAPEGTFLDQMELDDIVEQFKKLVATLKQTEDIHEEKLKHLQKLHDDEIGIYQREIDMFRMKLEQVDKFQMRQTELDEEVKELLRNVESKFTNTVETMSKSHEVELKLKRTELEAIERRYLEEINHLKENQQIELDKLKESLLKTNERDGNCMPEFNVDEIKLLKGQVEELTVELLKCEGMIAMKEEIENALIGRIKELEDLIKFKEDQCRKELEDLLSKYMKVQTLLSAKEEIAKELEDRLKQTENLLEKSRSETEELDRTCVKLKENLQNLEMQKKEESKVHFLENNRDDQHDPVDHSEKLKSSFQCQVDIPKVDSLETLQYLLRCGELEKENEDLRNEIDHLKNDLIEFDIKKDFTEKELERVKSKSSVHNELILKYKNLQEEFDDVVSQKNILQTIVKSLEEEQKKLLAEVKFLKEKDSDIVPENEDSVDSVESLKREIEKLKDEAKELTEKIEGLTEESEKLQIEIQKHKNNNQELKNELEEAWEQRCEIEDQLAEVKKENALLNLHRTQLEKSNKRISSLINEGSPSIVSWLKIHETVEHIVDDVLALKTSFDGNTAYNKTNVNKTKSELKLLTESLNFQLENKTKLCNELMIQKKSLEKELIVLEELLRQSENNSLNQKSKYERELRNRNLAIKRLHLELESKQFLERAWEKKMDLKMRLAIDDHQLEKIKHSTEETYMMTKIRLKKHFEDQQKSREAQLKEALSHEIKLLKKEINNLEDEIRKKDKALNEKTDTEKQELEGLRVKYQEEIDHLTKEHKAELEKLRSMLMRMQETGNSSLIIHKMEEEHAKAMEELRTYYENKCADLEKQYSEEVYRQQSRKMSICSSMSESEIPIDLDSTESVNHVTEQIENKKRERILENYRNVINEKEDDEKKKKLENFLQDVLSGHNKELNYLHVKYNKEISNLEGKHTLEMNRINTELSETRKNIEIEKKIFEINLSEEFRKSLTEAIRSEIKEKFEKEKNGRLDDLLEKLKANCRKDMKSLEDVCVEELSRCQADSAIDKVVSVEKKGLEKDLEMEQIVNFYRSLYETALRKFEERQDEAIKIQKQLIEDYEKQIQDLKEAHKVELEHQIVEERIKWEKFRSREKELESELSSIKSTYEDELLELRKCCQDTLQEQVNLAKADALNSLQQQIQEYLQKDDAEDPTSKELLELEEKFAGKYRKEIEDLKQKHQGEVTRIKCEYEDRINRRYSTGSMPKRCLLNDLKTDDDKLEIIRERDALKDTVGSLRHVLSEFVRYIGICEDELNNSLVGEIRQADETMYKSFKLDKDLNDTDCSMISKRVHFAPDLSGIMSSIDESSLLNASMQIRMELDKCLKQLKNDANCLLALSNPTKKQNENVYGMLKKLEVEKSNLEEKVNAVEDMTKDLKVEVKKTKEKLSEWERNREIVSEGFGEEVVSPQKFATLSELKNKAKSLMTNEQCTQPSNIMSILEEICKEGDRLQEESRREKLDLQQQIEAADKQIRMFKKFVEDQAAEREQERDEFLNEINRLEEALKVKERDSSLKERTHEEVEVLENQLKETEARLAETREKKDEAEKKLKDAIDKVWSLREIIQDLEKQVAVASQREVDLQKKLKDLEDIIDHQNDANQMMVTELDSIKSQNNAEVTEYVRNLEEELINLRRFAEQTSPEAISQMKTNLRDIESALVRKTKELELLHASSANVSCSSPSEDVSIREHLDATRCPTPDEMHCHDQSRGCLLFEEIDRINEKLIKHNRAEEVALKSIRDLEMQLKSLRRSLDEVQSERDVLLDRVELYLQENSSLKARLDEQRCNAGVIQRQLSHELESQIKRLEEDIEKLNNLCLQKDKQIRDMNAILEQTTKSLQIRENEVLNKSKEENALITRLKTDLQNVLQEKAELEEKLTKMSEKARDNATLPVLVDAMLEEKNAEIDQLKNEILRLSGQRAVSSLINSKFSTESMNSRRVKFSEPDSFIEFISPILPENVSVMRSAGDSYADLKISSHRLYKPLVCISTPESLSSIGPLQLSPRGLEPRRQSSWSSLPKSTSTSINPTEQPISDDISSLKKQLNEKTRELKKYESQLSERSAVDSEIGAIRNQLQSTMQAVEEDKQFYKKQFEQMLKTEEALQHEIDSKRREISEQLIEMDTLRQNLIEKTDELDYLKVKYDEDIAEKNKEIEKLKINCRDLERELEDLKEAHADEKKELKNQLNFEKNRVESALREINLLEGKKVEIEEEFLSLKKDYNEKLIAEQKSNNKLKNEINDLQGKNSELGKQFAKVKIELETALRDAEKISQDFGSELSGVREENKKLKNDYLTLQNNLESCMNLAKNKEEISVQTDLERDEKCCQTYENVEMALVPLKNKNEQCDEFSQFQENIQKLRYEISTWEEKMDKNELKKDEALSFLALVRTLLTCIVDNLDDHFYELETYRKKMMECSVDDLTDRVQRELLLSAKLDSELLSSFQNAAVKIEEPEEIGGGDNLIIPKQSNFVNVTLRISELEANLQDEMEKNSELKNEVENLKFEKEGFLKRIEKQKNFIKLLEDSLAKEKKKLATEKSRYDEDAKIMEVLRVNFEKGLDKIEELEAELNNERQEKALLEKKLEKDENFMQMDSENRILSDLKRQLDAERQKIISLGINVEKEKRKCQELRASLEREKLERMSEKDVQRLMGSDLALLQGQKENLENQLTNARELLKAQGEEIAALRKKISLQEIDIKALAISNEHQVDKDSDYSIMVERIRGLEQELDFYRSEVHALTEKPDKSIPPPLLLKMKDLNNCVEQHVLESNEMGEALLHLTQETEQMKSLIRKLEESTEQNSGKSNDDTLLADIEMERRSWMSEKEKLISELETIKAEYEILKQTSLETFRNNDIKKLEIKKLNKEIENLKEELLKQTKNDSQLTENRAIHLFGKYMRAESYRKALAWQKRYLMLVISSYEESEEDTWLKLNRLANKRKDFKRHNVVKTKRRSLKGVAIVVVAIQRMQYMVKRWRHGRIAGVQALLGRQEGTPSKTKAINRPSSTITLTNGPIDPLSYQTHNFIRPRSQPSPVEVRKPLHRDTDLRNRLFSPTREVTNCRSGL